MAMLNNQMVIQSICSIPGPVETLLNVDPLWNLLVPNGAVCSALGRAFWTANLGIEYATLQVLFSAGSVLRMERLESITSKGNTTTTNQ
jgi:hypothetical protein